MTREKLHEATMLEQDMDQIQSTIYNYEKKIEEVKKPGCSAFSEECAAFLTKVEQESYRGIIKKAKEKLQELKSKFAKL